MHYGFPEGFMWGAATAAHQVEGDNLASDFWTAEHTPGTPFKEPSGYACDHYNRYEEDIGLLAGLGLNTYRFSVEWARVEPEPGYFSKAQLDHYRRMCAACLERGVTPVVTYQHFTSPRWMAADGGWREEKNADRFARYCERVTEHLGDMIGYACTINEANGPALLAQEQPDLISGAADPSFLDELARRCLTTPERLNPFLTSADAKGAEVILAAHRKAYERIKSGPGDFPVGITLALTDRQAAPGGEEARDQARAQIDGPFLDAVSGDDFVGVQTYTRAFYGPAGYLPPGEAAELTQMGWEYYPEALEGTLRYVHGKTGGVPLLVTENGVATADDEWRVAYTRRALEGVARCIEDGLDVHGYLHWSLLDNFEWLQGYAMTFGLVGVDRESLERAVKPSARWLGGVAKNNGIEKETA